MTDYKKIAVYHQLKEDNDVGYNSKDEEKTALH